MPTYREDWYEEKGKIFSEAPDFALDDWNQNDLPHGVQVVTSQGVIQSNRIDLDPVELRESRKRASMAWEWYRLEIEEEILMAFAPLEPSMEELDATKTWMLDGLLRYGYLDDGELSHEQIARMIEARLKFFGN